MRDKIRLKGRALQEALRSGQMTEYFRHWKFYLSQIGFKIAEYNSQKIVKNV